MIGLPTETDEDIEAIRGMAMKALHMAKKNTGRFVNISITVSPFVPKPHTPFQWYGQIGLDEIKRKQKYLKDVLSSKKFKYKGHDEHMSFLEAVFARGDERLSPLIEKAWGSGCRLDGWSEMFDFNKWLDAMDMTGIDGSFYAQRSFGKDESLPWDSIDTGIKKSFLYREYERAFSEERTQDCRKVCTACGLKCKTEIERIRVRVQFSKAGKLRYLSHLELVTTILRGLRRASVPFDFSKGFHPSPMVSFGPPLSVGVAGEGEYFDMEVFTPFDIEFYIKELNATMPAVDDGGIRINKMKVIPMDAPSLNSFIKRYEYIITQNTEYRTQNTDKKSLGSVLWALGSPLIVQRDGKDVDISPCIEDIRLSEDGLVAALILRDSDNIKVRIGEIADAIFGMNMNELQITRTALYGQLGENNEWVEPL
jgi:radical SAM-linked protein